MGQVVSLKRKHLLPIVLLNTYEAEVDDQMTEKLLPGTLDHKINKAHCVCKNRTLYPSSISDGVSHITTRTKRTVIHIYICKGKSRQ